MARYAKLFRTDFIQLQALQKAIYVAGVKVKTTIKIDPRELEFIEKYLGRLRKKLTTGLSVFAVEGARGIQEEIERRALFANAPGDYEMLFTGATEQQPAIAQLRNRILPMIMNTQNVTQKGNWVDVGLVDLNMLAEVKITDLVTGHAGAPDIGASEKAFGKEVGPKGGRIATQAGGRSEFIETWQIVEFGTGIFARHPDFGWNKRLTGPTKHPEIPGAWFLDPKAFARSKDGEEETAKAGKSNEGIALGQPGGHFLFGARGEATGFALVEIDIALKRINALLDRILG